MCADVTQGGPDRASTRKLTETVQAVRTLDGDDDGEVSVGEVVENGGEKGILPAMLLVALIAATPLSGIPGVSVVCGLLIALVGVELMFDFSKLYLPRKLKNLSIDADKLHKVMGKIEPVLAWIDRRTGDRMTFLFHRPLIWIPQVLCVISGLAMPFLEFIPFSSSIAAFGVSLLCMAMLTRDGIFFLLAMIPYGVAIVLMVQVLI